LFGCLTLDAKLDANEDAYDEDGLDDDLTLEEDEEFKALQLKHQDNIGK
jgi:hypothetical protein